MFCSSSCPVIVDPPTFCLVAIFKVESKELELELVLFFFVPTFLFLGVGPTNYSLSL